MFDDDDDDGDSQSRYPSIPSLVALQLMKNRLQLANLGRKLMKWSSMATGKELRKRAAEMNWEFQNYGEQVANAYLLLARARFYNPEINKNVLQNVGRNAACVVEFENKTLIGVRFFEMNLIERNHDPNLHLGLEKGGEAIAAAKQAWRNLLKEMILMLEHETAFHRIYVANKSSTKKQNVLGKVIIPKITNAIAYIKSELEEKEREETFRLKRFKYSKAKKVEREDRARKLRYFQEPETIIEEPELIEEPKTIAELKKIKEPEIIEKRDNIEEIDILAELDIFEDPEINEEREKLEEPEKIEPKVMMLQIKTSKQKDIEPETIVLDTYAPEVTVSVSDITFSYTAMSEGNVAEVVPAMSEGNVAEVKLQEPDIILPEFIIQGEPSPLEKQKTLMPEIIFEGKPAKVPKNWDQFVNTPPYKDMSETASTKQSTESTVSCPLCKAQTDVTNQRVLHLIDHVNQFLMLCKQNKIDFTNLETKGDKFNYKNIKKELELLSFSYSCPHKSLEERNKGDVGKSSCLMQRPSFCDEPKRKREKEQESIYKCLSRQSSAMSCACKKTQIDNMTNNGSVTSFFPTNCKFSFHSQCLTDANYFEYCNWTPELTLQYEKTHNNIYPSTSARRERDNNGTQTSHHSCRCLSEECSLSIRESQSPKPSNDSPYFKKSPTYYTSMPQTHYTSLSKNLVPYLNKKNTSNFKYFTNLLQNTLPMALYASESRSESYRISDIIYTSDWTNVTVPKEFATVATYQPNNVFSPFVEGLFDSYEISDTFDSVDSSKTVIRNDSLTCMTVLPQGYPGVVPYMSRFGFADVINNNPANVPVLKEYAKVNDRQFRKGLISYTPEGRAGTSRISEGVSSVFFIANDSTSCSSDDTASISGISDTEINEDCVTGVLSQNDGNLEIDAQNEKTDCQPSNLNQKNAESAIELADKHKNKNYPVYIILTPDQNWPFNSYMREQTHKKNGNNYQIGAKYLERGNSSKTTSSSGTCKFKDFSVYVTLTPSQNSFFKPSRREVRPGLSTSNTTGTATYIDNATYVTTVRRKNKNGSYKTCSESTDPIQSRTGLGGVFDVRNITATETLTYSAPYTREGKPGPSNFSNANNGQLGRVPNTQAFEINSTNPITSSTPFTREGKPGPFGIYEASNVNTTKHIEPVPYTREGRPGPFDISETMMSSAPYTSEKRPGPYEISELKNIRTSIPCSIKGRLLNDISETCQSLTTTIFPTPKNQECGPGKCGVYSVVCVYTSEGTPRHCGLIEVCKNTCSNPCKSPNLRKCGHCGTSEKSNTSDCNSVTPCLPYTRDGRSEPNNIAPTVVAPCKSNTQICGPGRCGVYNVVSVYTSEGNPRHCGLIEICKDTCSNPCTSSNGRKCGHFGTSEISNTSDCNSVTPCLPYTREGRQRPNDMYSNAPMTIASSKPNTQECAPGRCGVYSIVCVYTGEGEPKHCGLIEICKNPCSKPLVCSTNTREGKSGPCGTSEISNITGSQTVRCFLPYTREEKQGSGITKANNIIASKQIGSVPNTREGRPGPFDISEISNNIASKQITPYTREGKPGPFGVSEKNNTRTTKPITPVPYTREGRPGPFDICETSNNIASKRGTPYTREGKPGPFGFPEKNNIITTKQIAPVPYTREGRPGSFDISEMTNDTASNHVTTYTREGKPGPFDISEKKNIITTKHIAPVSYTRKGRPGPFDIYETSNYTTSIHVTPNTREGRPGPFGISEVNDTTTDKLNAPVPNTREGKPGPFDVPEINNIMTSKLTEYPVTYTRESTPGPYDISETKNTTRTKQVHNNITAPELNKSSAPYTRESVPRPCGISEPCDMNSSFLSYREPCEVYSIICGYTREGKPGPCCNRKINDITTPYTREGKPGPFSISGTNIITTSKQCQPIPNTREGRPGPFNIPEMNCCRPKQLEPYRREGKPGPCGILDESNMACPKHPTSCKSCKQKDLHGPYGFCERSNISASNQFEPMPYTREGRPGPFNTSRTISTPRVYTRESRPVPFELSEISNVTLNNEIADTTYNVFMATTNPCQCGFNAPSTQKEVSSSATSKSDQSCIETEYKKHTKNYRYKECDGTIVDEKRITIIKIKKRKPQKQEALEANKSTCISQNLENGTDLECKCCKQSKSENIRSSPDVMPCPKMRTSISTQVLKTENCNNKKLEDQASSPKCDCGDKELPKSPPIPCPNKPEDKKCYCGAEAPPKPSSCACSKKPEDSASGPKCNCGEGASAKPSSCACSKKTEDSPSGPKCKCVDEAPPKLPPLACSNMLKDSASSKNFDCGGGAPSEPPPISCPNKPKDSASGPKCNCGGGASAKPSSCACSNKPEDSANGPKCKCGDKGPKCNCGNKAPPKPPLVCANRLEDSASGPKCDCGEKAPKPPSLVCANRLEDSASGPKCDCGEKASKPPSLVCANRLEDSASGPKCDCGEKTSKPPSLVCVNRLEDSASGPKCDCGDKAPKPPPLVCANRLEDSASGPKCDCGGGTPPKPPLKSILVCANRLEDSASGPKCDCGDEAPKPPPLVCANRLEDSASGPKCDCGEKTSKPPSLVCANRLEDSASGPKCDCGGGAPPEPPPIPCPNKPKDSHRGPKCDCGGGATPKPSPIPCLNKPKDEDSGLKCDCGAPPTPCPNKPKDSTSGPKCDCGGGAPPPIPCPNKPKGVNSGPKCDCGAPPIPCPNKPKDSASGQKCNCGSVAKPPPNPCPNKPKDSASGQKCDCGVGAKPPPIPCPNKPKDSASGPKCNCGGGAPPAIPCPNKPKDSASGPKCDCGSVAKPPPNPCPNKPKDSALKCNCGGGAPPPIPCPNQAKDTASGPKCDCGGIASSKPSSCACSKKPKESGPKCECGGGAPSKKSSSITCPNKLKDKASGPKCDCGGGAPPPIPCPNKSKDSASGPKCECEGGGNKPKNSNSSCGQVSGNRVVDLTHGAKCECGDKAPPKRANKLKDSASGATCNCVKEPPLSFDPVCHNLSRGSKTSNVSKKNSKTRNAPKCDCAKEEPPTPKSACGGGAPANTSGCGNKVEETCQTGISDYPLCACTGEALSKALLQKVLNTLCCEKSPLICAPPDKPDRHANCFKEGNPSGTNKKKTCALCGSPVANKETHPSSTKAKCVCSDSSVHAPRNVSSKSKINKNNKNTTCGYCTFGRLAHNSNGQSKNTCEIDNKNYRYCNSTREQNDAVSKLCIPTNKNKNDNDSFCTIKIITKSQKSPRCETEYTNSLAFIATNTFEALRQLYRSPDHKKNKNICQTCYSPLTPSVGSEIREKPCLLCEFCQDKLVQENERGYRCTTYGVESTSCRSPAEGSPSRSMYNQKTNSSSRGCGNCRQL